MSNVEALKNLAVALGCAKTADEVKGGTTAEVIQFMADNVPKYVGVLEEQTTEEPAKKK